MHESEPFYKERIYKDRVLKIRIAHIFSSGYSKFENNFFITASAWDILVKDQKLNFKRQENGSVQK